MFLRFSWYNLEVNSSQRYSWADIVLHCPVVISTVDKFIIKVSTHEAGSAVCKRAIMKSCVCNIRIQINPSATICFSVIYKCKIVGISRFSSIIWDHPKPIPGPRNIIHCVVFQYSVMRTRHVEPQSGNICQIIIPNHCRDTRTWILYRDSTNGKILYCIMVYNCVVTNCVTCCRIFLGTITFIRIDSASIRVCKVIITNCYIVGMFWLNYHALPVQFEK